MKRVLLAAAGAWGLAQAHHSFGMYDESKIVTVSGTVAEFRWTNPHVVIVVETAAGVSWTIENTSTGNLKRMGWTRHSVVAGETVTVELAPLRDGSHGGSFLGAKLSDGKVLGEFQ